MPPLMNVRAPFVAPVTVISPAAKPVTAVSKVRVNKVVEVSPLAPLAVSESKVLAVGAVAAKTAVITPELIGFVTEVAPTTVKKFAPIPVSVYPVLGVRVIVAV